MNRFEIQQMLDGVRASLKKENEKLNAMYMDGKTTIEARNEQVNVVRDLEEREKGIAARLKKFDDEAAAKLEEQNKGLGNTQEDKVLNAKAELIRSVMAKQNPTQKVLAALGVGSTLGNGDKFLPSTMVNDLLYEPMAKNPLRKLSVFTNITNLEIPKITFSLSDDNFLEDDTATAKELKADGDTVVFGRNKFKVFCDITETVLNGTNTNLVQVVEAGLQSGLAKKEKKVAYAKTETTTMSFYHKTDSSNYDIKSIKGKTLYEAIIEAIADLEEDYSENASVTMRKVDYYKMIKDLANGNATLYMAPPEQILGVPVEFCDLAEIPVVGDYKYSHFNYDLKMLFDRDKNVKTGLESFVLTAWIDHKIKMKSAFRLAEVTPS
ncbi:TPA: phage major capsid protein [Clostridium perfringens]|uniref:phage major capsid protein n=1 Tax=Clostridium perfringens TaxID=1502 RepID=UPI000DF1012A|nr:phage major capsid protein [Clostridium perfringens]EHK2354947.1 phage major capsid protein [Clostridium perfringens]EHK2386700.1 phage major capsid protein [Clostridium perfringens]EIF6157034.1 phage major capsid protein [Clostridium perfringens]MBI6009246.1 phage major capsid protein [Clostridium perfringens]MCO6001731.1 phage major capsid protein [Clostridium perfringens]